MPPKRTRSTSAKAAVARNSQKNRDDDAVATATTNSASTSSGVVLPLDPPRQGQTTAASLFSSSSSSPPASAAAPRKSEAAKSSFSGLNAAALLARIDSLPDIDDSIMQQGTTKNSFLTAVAALLLLDGDARPLCAEITGLLCGFLRKTAVVSAKTFFFALRIAVMSAQDREAAKQTTSARGRKKQQPATGGEAGINNTDALRAIASIVSASAATTTGVQKLRGSATEAARSVFFNSNDDDAADDDDQASSLRLVEPAFTSALHVLVAAVDAGRMEEVRLLGNVLDGMACAAAAFAATMSSTSSLLIPLQTLREAAELLATLGRFATIGSPRLRGMISAWNGPALTARKEAMVVAGGPFAINVAPEFEVRHVGPLKL